MHVETHQTQVTGYETYSVRNILSFIINRKVKECPSFPSYCCFCCIKKKKNGSIPLSIQSPQNRSLQSDIKIF